MEMRLRPSAIEIEYNNAIFLKKLHSKEEEDLFGKCPKVKIIIHLFLSLRQGGRSAMDDDFVVVIFISIS